MINIKLYTNKQGLDFYEKTNLGKVSIIKFIRDGYESKVSIYNFKYGKVEVKNPFHPEIFNVGYYGNPNGDPNEDIYNTWRNMLARCYSVNFKNNKPHDRYYGRVFVSHEWFNYANFKSWVESEVDSYNPKIHRIDKDIISSQNGLVYSPQNCLIVTHDMNNVDVFKYSNGYRMLKNNKTGRTTLYIYNNETVDLYSENLLKLENIKTLFSIYKMKKLARYNYELKNISYKTFFIIDNDYNPKEIKCDGNVDMFKDDFKKCLNYYLKHDDKFKCAIKRLNELLSVGDIGSETIES